MTKRVLKGITYAALTVMIAFGLILLSLMTTTISTGIYQRGAGEYAIAWMAAFITYIVSLSYFRYIAKMEKIVKMLYEDSQERYVARNG